MDPPELKEKSQVWWHAFKNLSTRGSETGESTELSDQPAWAGQQVDLRIPRINAHTCMYTHMHTLTHNGELAVLDLQNQSKARPRSLSLTNVSEDSRV